MGNRGANTPQDRTAAVTDAVLIVVRQIMLRAILSAKQIRSVHRGLKPFHMIKAAKKRPKVHTAEPTESNSISEESLDL